MALPPSETRPPLPPPLKVTPQTQSDLQQLSNILHLLHHRNHNQHRRSPWYRHFSTFRRHLATLLSHLDILSTQPTTQLGKHRKKATDAKTHVQIQLELGFWRDVLVPKWALAFGQVLADGRFAVLGVVLVAVLAQVGRLVGVLAEFERLGEEEVRRVLERFAREEWAVDGAGGEGGDEGIKIERAEDGGGNGNEDFGEALKRDEGSDETAAGVMEDAKVVERDVRAGEGSACMGLEQDVLRQSLDALKSGVMSPAASESVGLSPAPVKKSKLAEASTSSNLEKKRLAKNKATSSSKPPKKKKKKNAIDDLFSGL